MPCFRLVPKIDSSSSFQNIDSFTSFRKIHRSIWCYHNVTIDRGLQAKLQLGRENANAEARATSGFSSLPQINSFSSLKKMDSFCSLQKMDSFTSLRKVDVLFHFRNQWFYVFLEDS